jgi:hypothetical protein
MTTDELDNLKSYLALLKEKIEWYERELKALKDEFEYKKTELASHTQPQPKESES